MPRYTLTQMLAATNASEMWKILSHEPHRHAEYVYVGLDLLHERGEASSFVEYAIEQTKICDRRDVIAVLLLSLAWLAVSNDTSLTAIWSRIRKDVRVYIHTPGEDSLQELRYTSSTCKAQATIVVESTDVQLDVIFYGMLADIDSTDEFEAVAAE